MFLHIMAKRQRIYREQKGAKNRTLKDTTAHLSHRGSSQEELEQQKRFCWRPTQVSTVRKQCKRMPWSTVSNAALKSKRTQIEQSPLSAVSSNLKKSCLCTMKCSKTRLEKVKNTIIIHKIYQLGYNYFLNLEIGLKLLKDRGSKLGFFSSGWIIACLKLYGKEPEAINIVLKQGQ